MKQCKRKLPPDIQEERPTTRTIGWEEGSEKFCCCLMGLIHQRRSRQREAGLFRLLHFADRRLCRSVHINCQLSDHPPAPHHHHHQPITTTFVTMKLISAVAASALALVVAILPAVVVVVEAQTVCSFLPDVEPIVYELPSNAIAPGIELPMEFHGLSATVSRRTTKHGETPRVLVTRYSAGGAPSVTYDETLQKVIVSSNACAASVTGSGAATGTSGSCNTKTPNFFLAGAAATAALGASLANNNLAAAAATTIMAAAAGYVPGVQAQDDSGDVCLPVVQIVVEAPNTYKGAVEVCHEEINDTSICPDPFPIYATCSDAMPECKLAVVGAGAGGLYTALRMVDENKVDASDVCIFEMTERVGGRLFSLRGLGPDGDLSVDAGGYRTWPEFTPTTHALITGYLGIPMGCYDDADPCIVFNIVDEEGKKDGFTTFVEEMMTRLVDGGACFYPHHELESFAKVESTDAMDVTELRFSNGVTAKATFTTVLNIPQRPLMNIVRNSDLDAVGMLDAETLDALHSVQTVVATKLYLYYPRGSVFWRQLGIVSGDFESPGDARNMLLAGRYHDGHVECDDPLLPDTCHGFLLAVYANDLSGNKAQFFRRYQRTRAEPVTIIADQDLEGREFLRHAHDRLVNYHLYEKTDAPYTGFEAERIMAASSPPTFGILSTWSTDVPWAGGAWHSWTELSNIDKAKQPFVEDNIFVINEAYSLLHGWAEGSLKVADEILMDFFDVPRPWDFDSVDLNQIVLQTNSEECVEPVDDGTGASQASGGDSGGDGNGGTASVLCFTGAALVEMADGSFKKIQDVVTGDVVATGTGLGAGVVTEALVHPVGKQVQIATLLTDMGELVGTPDHPVLIGDTKWVEFGSFDTDAVMLETRHIDAFYNLEIDGDCIEESSHSYVVNGVVASGLGDNKVLNVHFARQKEW